ncbi:hypothetical protein AKG07_10355 [Microbacterium sp. CGR1]|nr:hypothetical protein AKG07_10355 [Microbacterium sp. CGR1]
MRASPAGWHRLACAGHRHLESSLDARGFSEVGIQLAFPHLGEPRFCLLGHPMSELRMLGSELREVRIPLPSVHAFALSGPTGSLLLGTSSPPARMIRTGAYIRSFPSSRSLTRGFTLCLCPDVPLRSQAAVRKVQ